MGEGIRPIRLMNFGEAVFATFITGAVPKRPPKFTMSPAFLPGAGITLTLVVLLFITPMESSSAMMVGAHYGHNAGLKD